jgi:ubiquinone/menaquinone biosynthesis C-methylase UbiE
MDGWKDKASAEKYARAELATRPFADLLVQTSKLPAARPEDEVYVIDIAAGTGAVEAAIYDALPKEKLDTVKVLGTDLSQSMLDYLEARGEQEGWEGLETKIVDGTVSLVWSAFGQYIY